MANDVTITVEAELGSTLLKLELAKLAVNDLEDAGGSAGVALGDESNRNSFASRIGFLQKRLSNLGDRGPLGLIVRGFGNMAAAMLTPIQLGAKFAQQFEQVGQVGQVLIGTVASLGIGLAGLAATIFTVVFAAEALASILGTLVAIVADLVAPVTIVGTLLGGLAAAFVIGGKRAAEGGGKLNEFSRIVDTLGSMFGRTSNILAHVFLPYLVELGHAGERALNFLDRIVKLPLGQAFRAIDTRGTKLLGEFVDRVAEVLSKPIRLAFRVAFEDTAFASMVEDWWHRFTGFLFGSTERHPVELRPGVFKIKQTTVDGVFQPFIEWFNRHHFTAQGIRIGQQILGGLLNSGMRGRIVTFFGQVFRDAARRAGAAVISTLNQPLGPVLLGLVKRAGSGIIHILGQAWQAVARSASHSWDVIAGSIRGIWNRIVGFITQPISINIDWPSPPSWWNKIPGNDGGLLGIFSAAGIGSPGGSAPMPIPRGPRGGGAVVSAGGHTINMYTGPLDSLSARRKTIGMVDRHLQQRWNRSGR